MKVFLASARESKKELRLVESWLQESKVRTIPWYKEGLFPLGEYTLPRLVAVSRNVDGAVFIFGPNDQVQYRQETVKQPRDNVLIEYGIFASALGPKRTMICRVKGAKMASDLAGITLLDVTPEKNASNQEAVAKWVKDLRMPADKGRRVIRCEGTAFDFRTIDKDHKICRLERELSYSLTDVTITICNPTVTMRSSLVIKDGKKEILHGTYSAEGVFENPNAYMIYRVERPSTGEPWRGVSKVRIVPAYDIVGLWMAEGHFEQGKTCLGTFRLRRLDE